MARRDGDIGPSGIVRETGESLRRGWLNARAMPAVRRFAMADLLEPRDASQRLRGLLPARGRCRLSFPATRAGSCWQQRAAAFRPRLIDARVHVAPMLEDRAAESSMSRLAAVGAEQFVRLPAGPRRPRPHDP